ncbi:hypothetical protein [Rhizobium phaseoli]|uniref:hypothetical protein n=1 Tax=Rhizobium phaseoli TaxID=396 RepID=UPI000369160C|nr:hypothetical protein [Rhizobium phaseoli]KKZ88549.1 hypothetical protein RPHASCH2410_CH05190 [Rhizobium phaseoli Ch24-10]
MGSVKEHLLAIRPDHELVLACPRCGYPSTTWVRPPELLGENEEEDEDNYSVEYVECMRCDDTLRVEITPRHESYGVVIVGHPDADVKLDALDMSSDEPDWDDLPEPEPQPHDIFQAALKDWWSLLGKLGDKNSGSASVNRMLFSQLFSIFEAYLSDEIVGLAMRDTGIQKGIIGALPALKKQTVSLSIVVEKPNLVRDEVRGALQRVSFHNLPLVDSICASAIGKQLLPPSKEIRDHLANAVTARHDCVHRNGYDINGALISTITVDWLMMLSKHFEAMARALTFRIAEIDTARQMAAFFSQPNETDRQSD